MHPAVTIQGSPGNLSTGGDLVFQGSDKGAFYALDARTGKRLFTYTANGPIVANPISYRVDGRQYADRDRFGHRADLRPPVGWQPDLTTIEHLGCMLDIDLIASGGEVHRNPSKFFQGFVTFPSDDRRLHFIVDDGFRRPA